jgi:hypothetical protein
MTINNDATLEDQANRTGDYRLQDFLPHSGVLHDTSRVNLELKNTPAQCFRGYFMQKKVWRGRSNWMHPANTRESLVRRGRRSDLQL